MNNKLVSVVIPIYNVEKYLKTCVDSILNQTYRNTEVILVDDGSPDSSPYLCDKYEDADMRVKVIHKKNGGLSDARNTGLAIAKGDYIVFLDSDDYVEPTMIEDAVTLLERHKAEIAIWGFYADFVTENELVTKSVINSCVSGIFLKEEMKNILITEGLIGILGYAWNKMYKTQLLLENGFCFTKGLSLVEDIVFNVPVLSKAEKIVFIEKPYVHYMQRHRETLGARFYENYFELKEMAMNSIETLLNEWGLPQKTIEEIVNKIGFNALKSTVRILSKSTNYLKMEKYNYLKILFDKDDVQQIIIKTKTLNIKDGIIKHFMKRKVISLLLIFYGYNK